MTTTTPEFPTPSSSAHAVRPFYWSVRRELWEHRSLYIAPAAAAGVVLFGFLISAMNMGHFRGALEAMDPQRRATIALIPYQIACAAVFLTAAIAGVLYCLGALHNERRDRTILFWKSLPVSDLMTVLSKAAIPLVVLPAIAFAVILAVQLVMLAVNAMASAAAGLGPPTAVGFLPWLIMVAAYGLVTMTLWYAPIWGWFLLVSAWAKRTPFLWAFLPPLALVVVERIAFDTDYVARLLGYRLGSFDQGFAPAVAGVETHGILQPDPLRFLSNPDVWTGLAVGAGLLAAAVWVRRYREPI